jgi:hypothetical protein
MEQRRQAVRPIVNERQSRSSTGNAGQEADAMLLRFPALILAASLAAPAMMGLASASAQVRVGVAAGPRVYDRRHRDYHVWDGREDREYRQYLAERHHRYVAYARQRHAQQSAYWQWRHERLERR